MYNVYTIQLTYCGSTGGSGANPSSFFVCFDRLRARVALELRRRNSRAKRYTFTLFPSDLTTAKMVTVHKKIFWEMFVYHFNFFWSIRKQNWPFAKFLNETANNFFFCLSFQNSIKSVHFFTFNSTLIKFNCTFLPHFSLLAKLFTINNNILTADFFTPD